jgi:hypothetical protein
MGNGFDMTLRHIITESGESFEVHKGKHTYIFDPPDVEDMRLGPEYFTEKTPDGGIRIYRHETPEETAARESESVASVLADLRVLPPSEEACSAN